MKTIEKNEVIAIIPAKGYSRRLPNKNIMVFNGKPMLSWSIEAALGSEFIKRTFVSSECEDIISVARSYGVDIINRPKKLSGDTSSSESVILHALNHFNKNEKYLPRYFILLQPTSPLRSSLDIDNAFKCFFESKANALISGYEIKFDPFKSLQIDNSGFLNRPKISGKRFLKYFYQNGAIYINKTNIFMKSLNLFPSVTVPFFMDKSKSIDIDFKEDFIKASKYQKKIINIK
ncbi:MAG: Acylneuraminate cytidylyltransferase [uncultured bacterium]|nr:MAG: Acylneuraminate cytidylyltransferase [uncultured bacterium]